MTCLRSSGGPLRLVMALALLALAAGRAGAQEPDGLVPSFGDGRLTITGAGFQPGERVVISARAGGTSREFTTTADDHGRFRLATDMRVPQGSAVAVEARGDRGTTQAAITGGTGFLPLGPGDGGPDDSVVKSADDSSMRPVFMLVGALALAVVGAVGIFGWRRRARTRGQPPPS